MTRKTKKKNWKKNSKIFQNFFAKFFWTWFQNCAKKLQKLPFIEKNESKNTRKNKNRKIWS